jgi:adenine-specific DNA-methyltransferase
MNNKNQKLELTWIGKDEQPRLEPRILLEDAGKSYHVPHRMTENDIFDNQLIFGGNLLSLTALEAQRNKKRRSLQSLFAFRWSLK